MGWRASLIIIKSDREVDHKKMLQSLGYTDLERIPHEPLLTALYPKERHIYIGRHKGNTIICEQNLPFSLLVDTVAGRERTLSRFFPAAEICALTLLSGVNLWGYSVSRKGVKIRARTGSRETGTILDIGEPLPEERPLLARSSVDESGNRVYHMNDKDYFEDQLGEEFVFEISKKYFGIRLDHADITLMDTPMQGYVYASDDKLSRIRNKRKRERWLLLFVIVFVLIFWHILKKLIWG